jgi:hypothetical protein
MEARIAPIDPCRRRREESQIFRNIVRDSSSRLLRRENHVGIEPGAAVARQSAAQSAAKQTRPFQMAAFSRKPLRYAKLFYLFDDEHFDRLAARHEFETELVKHGLFESFVMFVFSFEKRIPLGHMNASHLPIHNHT